MNNFKELPIPIQPSYYIGIDPGDKLSAIVLIDENENVCSHDILNNGQLLKEIPSILEIIPPSSAVKIGIEMIASYGMPVGKNVFETCIFIGRLIEVIKQNFIYPRIIYRKEVKMQLCNSMKAKDGNIRQAIIDRYPATGGGKNPVIGVKSQPGPLFGIAKDKWAALGVAITAKARWNEFETFESWMEVKS